MPVSPRIREFARADLETFRAAANRARVFDHRGNRGGEFEAAVLRWIRDRVEPAHTACGGEVIDSAGTMAVRPDRDASHPVECACERCRAPSRQHDVIVHANERDARRFTFSSGLRLVPVESVAAVVEVKLRLDAAEFEKTDAAAALTMQLRGKWQQIGQRAGAGTGEVVRVAGSFIEHAMTDEAPPFYIFAADCKAGHDRVAKWLRGAAFVRGVFALNTGFMARSALTRAAPEVDRVCFRASVDNGLLAFESFISGACEMHERRASERRVRWTEYASRLLVNHYDVGGLLRAGRGPARDDVEELLREDSGLLTQEERAELIRRIEADKQGA